MKKKFSTATVLNYHVFYCSNDNEGKKLLAKLSAINRPLQISFKEMVQLMSQCEVVDKQTMLNSETEVGHSVDGATPGSSGLFPQSPLSLFSGIIPGNTFSVTIP